MMSRKNLLTTLFTKAQHRAMPGSTLKRLTLNYPLYDIGKGLDDEPTDHHYTTVAGPHYTAVDGPHYDVVNKDSRARSSMGRSTHPTSPAAYDEIKTSMDTYSVPFSPDTGTYTVPANQTQKGRRAGDRPAKELEGGGSEKSITTAGAVYTVSKSGVVYTVPTVELEKSAATAGAVYAVVDKKKGAPPPLPPPYQPAD